MSTAVDEERGAQIVISHLGKVFRDIQRRAVVVLEDFSMTIRHQEFVAILGPSGCGKSTLLNIVAGFEMPSSGEVLLDGIPIKGPGSDRGVVFQEYSLFPWLNVHDNIAFGLRNKSQSTFDKKRIVSDLVDLVKLDGFTDTYPRELSGGMKQRVGIARALAIDPKILLMDEPFAALDALTRQQMQGQLLEIWRGTHKTVLFVTHSVEEALFLADRVVVMSRRPGRILKTLDLDMPRPRDVSAPDFNECRRVVSDLLLQELSRANNGTVNA